MAKENISRRMFLGILAGAGATTLASLAIARAAGGDRSVVAEPFCADGKFDKKEEDGEGPYQSLRIITDPDIDTSKGTITTLSEKRPSSIPNQEPKTITDIVRVTKPGEQLHTMEIVSYGTELNQDSFDGRAQIRPNGTNIVTVYERAGTGTSLEKGPILGKTEVVSPPCPPPPNPLTPSPS